MQKHFIQSISPFATVMMTLGIAIFAGCEKKPEVYTARGSDPAYRQALKDTRMRQNEAAAVRVRAVPQMKKIIEKARAALPEGATDEQVLAEINKNPQKYPSWKYLNEALQKADGDLKNEMANARNLVRERILKEAADRKAVEAGKATAKKVVAK